MASAANPSMGNYTTPSWVVNVRGEIGRSPAWEVLSDQLYEQISAVLKSHGLGHFSDLSSAEQVTLLEEAYREIMAEDNKVYQAFESQFSKSMDAEIAKEARARARADKAAKRDCADEALYLEHVLDAAAEGAVSLLRDLPREHLGSLRLMANQPIPSRARLDIWKMVLKHTTVRQEYELLMKQNRNSTISAQDIYITHRCQAMLESGRVATSRLLPLTSRNVVLMKTVLSYHHACKMSKRGEKPTSEVPESFLHFMVPLCAVVTRGGSFLSSQAFTAAGGGAGGGAASASSTKEQQIELMIEDLVEMFEGALEAGLLGLVDPNELSGVGGEGSGGGKNPGRDRKLATSRSARLEIAPTAPKVGSSTGDSGDGVPPPWVDVTYGALIPGFQGLVDHITRVHLGLPVITAACVTNGDMTKNIGNNSGVPTELSARGAEDSKEEDHGGAETSSPRLHKSSRRALINERRLSARRISETGAKLGDNNPGHAGGEPLSSQSSSGQPSSEPKEGGVEATGADEGDTGTSTIPPVVRASPSDTRTALWMLLKPLISQGLVGHLGADACLFAWDQAIIGGFGVMLPRVAAMLVGTAAHHLEACSTFARMSEVLLSHAPVVLVSQLQELMEAHCMPSIREELRVSEKLEARIVGPTLETSTQILDSVYAKRTKVAQEARSAHVEHMLGPPMGSTHMRTQNRLRLNLNRTDTSTSGSKGSGDMWSPSDKGERDRKRQGQKGGNGGEGGKSSPSDNVERNRNPSDKAERHRKRGGPRDDEGGDGGRSNLSDKAERGRKRGGTKGDSGGKGGGRSSSDKGGRDRERGGPRDDEEGDESGRSSYVDTADESDQKENHKKNQKGNQTGNRKAHQEDSQEDDQEDNHEQKQKKKSNQDQKPQPSQKPKPNQKPKSKPKKKRSWRSLLTNRSCSPPTSDDAKRASRTRGLDASDAASAVSVAPKTAKKASKGKKGAAGSRKSRASSIDGSDESEAEAAPSTIETDESETADRKERRREHGGGREEEENGAHSRTRAGKDDGHEKKLGFRRRSSLWESEYLSAYVTKSVPGKSEAAGKKAEQGKKTEWRRSTVLRVPRQVGGGGDEEKNQKNEEQEEREEQERRATEMRIQVEQAQLKVYRRTYTEKEIAALKGSERQAYDSKKSKFDKALRTLRGAPVAEGVTESNHKGKGGDRKDATRHGEAKNSQGKAKNTQARTSDQDEPSDAPVSSSPRTSPPKRWLRLGGSKTVAQPT